MLCRGCFPLERLRKEMCSPQGWPPHWRPNLELKAWRISGELLVFSLCWKPKDTSQGKQLDLRQTGKKRGLSLIPPFTWLAPKAPPALWVGPSSSSNLSKKTTYRCVHRLLLVDSELITKITPHNLPDILPTLRTR